MHALRDYFREYNASDRSSNVDATNRTLSVMDEFEANEVILFLSKESHKAENVWGDIYRNKFLKSVNNPPSALTPNHGEEFHSGLNEKKLKNSKL